MSHPILEEVQNKIAELQKVELWLQNNQEKLYCVSTEPSFFSDFIDFDNLSHDDVMTVIRTFPGRWDKNVNGDRINYRLPSSDKQPIAIRCYAGEPPPNCKIIEEEVVIPEHVFPARVEKRRRLVCKE